MPKLFALVTFNGIRAAEGVLYEDGLVALRLTLGEGQYADQRAPLVFAGGLQHLEAVVKIVGSRVVYAEPATVTVTQSKLTDVPRVSWPTQYTA